MLAQPAGHVVEGVGQVLDLVAAVDLDAVLEIARATRPTPCCRSRIGWNIQR